MNATIGFDHSMISPMKLHSLLAEVLQWWQWWWCEWIHIQPADIDRGDPAQTPAVRGPREMNWAPQSVMSSRLGSVCDVWISIMHTSRFSRDESSTFPSVAVGLYVCCVCSTDEMRTKDTCNLLLTLGVKISVILKKPITKKKKIVLEEILIWITCKMEITFFVL